MRHQSDDNQSWEWGWIIDQVALNWAWNFGLLPKYLPSCVFTAVTWHCAADNSKQVIVSWEAEGTSLFGRSRMEISKTKQKKCFFNQTFSHFETVKKRNKGAEKNSWMQGSKM